MEENLKWRKSRRCETSWCVEAAVTSDGTTVHVRDSKDPEGPGLVLPREMWEDFLGGVVDGDFEQLVPTSSAGKVSP